MKEAFAKKMKSLRINNGLTQDELCAALNAKFGTVYNKSMISRWENGKEEPRIETIRNLSAFFGLSLDAMLGIDGEKELEVYDVFGAENIKSIPILGSISAGKPVLASEHIEGFMPVLRKFVGEEDYFFLRVKGDSMNQEFPAGSLVLVHKTPVVENGHIAVVRVGDSDATVKRIALGKGTITLLPMSTNPEHLPVTYGADDEIEIIGRVVQAVKLY